MGEPSYRRMADLEKLGGRGAGQTQGRDRSRSRSPRWWSESQSGSRLMKVRWRAK